MKEVRNLILGFEIARDFSQIAYYDRKAQEPVSVATRVGTNLFTFPTALAKKKGREEWHFGVDAEYFSERGEAVSVPHFFEAVQTNTTVRFDGQEYETRTLLAIFMREALKLLGLPELVRATLAVTVTCERLTGEFAMNVKRALLMDGFTADKILIEDNEESFYYYCYSQQPSIWTRDIALIRFGGNFVRFQTLTEMRKMKPNIASIHPKGTITLPEENVDRDKAFAAFARKCIGTENFSSVFITGEGFGREWARDSVLVLCGQGRRVFEGNNLFVKGAVYAGLEKKERHAMKNRVYFCPYLLQKGVCVDVIRGESREVLPLIEPGQSWFDEGRAIEGILDSTKDVILTLVSMEPGWHSSVVMHLSGLPERPDRTTRIRIEAACTSDRECLVTVTDLGFGELCPATGRTWTKEMYLGPGRAGEGAGAYPPPSPADEDEGTCPQQGEEAMNRGRN